MIQPSYIKHYTTESGAWGKMHTLNRANTNPDWAFCLVDGPDGGFSVVDLGTAIELGTGYRWSA